MTLTELPDRVRESPEHRRGAGIAIERVNSLTRSASIGRVPWTTRSLEFLDGQSSTETIGGWTRGACTGLANFANDPALAAVADAAKTESGESIAAQLDELRKMPGRQRTAEDQ